MIISHTAGAGLSNYIGSFYKGFKLNGVDIKLFRFLQDSQFNDKGGDKLFFGENDILDKEINEDTINELNSADYVFVSDMPLKKHPEDFKTAYFNMIMNLKTKIVLFNNAHKLRSITSNYGDFKLNKELLLKVYKICAFDINCEYMCKVKEIIGEDLAKQKFINLQLPYFFDMDKKLWKPFNKKKKLLVYFGRAVKIKSPERIIKIQPKLVEAGYCGEIRGVSRSIAITGFEDMVYKFENGHATKEKSDKTIFITNKWKKEHGYDINDNLMDVKDRNGKTYVFGSYNYKDGLETMSYPFFAADFYHLENHAYGDTLEYVMYDIINAGTIPVFDTDIATNVYLFENGKRSNKKFGDIDMGLYLSQDLSNLDEFISNMNKISSDEKYFEDFRNNIFNNFCKHADAYQICKQFIEDLKE